MTPIDKAPNWFFKTKSSLLKSLHSRNTKETKQAEFINLCIYIHIGNKNKEKEAQSLRGNKAEHI